MRLPWSPLSGLVTPVLEGLSDYLEDLCDAPSDCDDGLPLTLDWCEAGFCRYEMLGAFVVPKALVQHGPCGDPEGCRVVVTAFTPCAPGDDWTEVCDDGDALTWDTCILGLCENLPCRGSCGCDPQAAGVDCLTQMVGESGFLQEYYACLQSCCLSGCGPAQWLKPPSCPPGCQEECLRAIVNRMTGGAEMACIPTSPHGLLCLNTPHIQEMKDCLAGEASGYRGSCVVQPKQCKYDWNCFDYNDCTEDRCEESAGPGSPKRCVYEVVTNGTACDDGDDCTLGDRCVQGRCTGVGALACNDGDVCTVDRCYPCGGCAHEPVTCDDEPDDCIEGFCLPQVGCVAVPKWYGTPCVNPLDPCADSRCDSAGRCEVQTPSGVTCDDHDPCTKDRCIPGQPPLCVHDEQCEEREVEGAGITVGYGYGLKFPADIIRFHEEPRTTAWPEADDADHDGLHDMAEFYLAQHFRPYYVFDSQEEGTAPWEPVVVFQAHPLLQRDGRERVRLNFVALWDYDPG